jgi:hypothetical protein
MMFGKVIAENAGAIRGFEKLQPFLVKLLEWEILPFQVIENSESNFHHASSSIGDSE